MDRIGNNRLTLFICLLLAAATMAAFWPVVHHDFINCDDQAYVYKNPVLQAGLSWQTVAWAFTTGYAGNWHPLTWLSHLLDVRLFGLNPGGHHLTSLLLHVANTLLLFLALKRMTGALWRSAVVAALFALHPLHVESVAWIAERKDVLSGFFFLLTLWAYSRYAEARGQRTEDGGQEAEVRGERSVISSHGSRITHHASLLYLLSLFFFACGLMSKPMLVTLPFVLLLLDYWPLRRAGMDCWINGLMDSWKTRQGGAAPLIQQSNNPTIQSASASLHHSTTPSLPSSPPPIHQSTNPSIQSASASLHQSSAPLLHLVVEKLPFFALAAASSVVTFLVQQRAGAMAATGPLPLDLRLENAMVSYLLYLYKTVWPSGLAIFYPYRFELSAGMLAVAVLVLIIITVLAGVSLRQQPYVAVGWLWFLGTLVPVIGLVQVGQQAMADRYTYLPLIGIFIAVVWSAAEWGGSRSCGAKVQSRGAGIRGQGTEDRRQRTAESDQKKEDRGQTTEDSVTLRSAVPCSRFRVQGSSTLRSAVQPSPASRSALRAEGRQGSGGRATEDGRFRVQALLAVAVLAACLVATRSQVRHWRDSEALFRHALAVTTDNALAHESLGDALARQDRVEEAEPHFAEAVRIRPEYPEALSDLGLARVISGKLEEGIEHYRAAIAVSPRYGMAHYNLARALCHQGKFGEAVQEYQTALELASAPADTRGFLAAALVQLGRTDEATTVFEDALKLKPADAPTHFQYASLLMVLGRIDDAAQQFEAALFNDPKDAETHRRYGLLLAGSGHPEQAIEQFREAIRLQPGAEVHYNLATALLQQGQPGQALAEYRESLRLKPDAPAVLNDLAWVLAASASESLRNGPEAVTLAERACQLTQFREPMLIGTLAAAYAEAGRFEDAVRTAEKARDLAAAGLKELAERNRQLLELYRAGKPYHETKQ